MKVKIFGKIILASVFTGASLAIIGAFFGFLTVIILRLPFEEWIEYISNFSFGGFIIGVLIAFLFIWRHFEKWLGEVMKE